MGIWLNGLILKFAIHARHYKNEVHHVNGAVAVDVTGNRLRAIQQGLFITVRACAKPKAAGLRACGLFDDQASAADAATAGWAAAGEHVCAGAGDVVVDRDEAAVAVDGCCTAVPAIHGITTEHRDILVERAPHDLTVAVVIINCTAVEAGFVLGK